MFSFFPYAGGKRQMARHYPRPFHSTIIEPFAGGAGYAHQYPDRAVKLYDIDPVIVGVWDYLIHVTPEELLALPLVFDHVDQLNIPQEAKWLIGFWIQRGSAMPGRKPSTWQKQAQYPSQVWSQRTKERLARQLHMIRHWEIKEASFENVPNDKGTWFIDPPYQGVRNRYRFDDVDYDALAQYAYTRIGQTIVAERKGAKWMPFKAFMQSRNLSRAKHKEVVWSYASANYIWIAEAEQLLAQLAALRHAAIPATQPTELVTCLTS